MRRAVLWELDGVIADTSEAHFRSWVTALAEWEIPLSREVLTPLLGLRNDQVLTRILGRSAGPQEQGTILSRKEHFFRTESEHLVRLYPGVKSLLSELGAAGWIQGLVSMMPQATVDLIVGQLGIHDHFQVIQSGEALPDAKPNPEILLGASILLRVKPEQCVVVDGTSVGVEAARQAGMRSLAVATIRPQDVLLAADHIARDMSAVQVATFNQLVENHGQ
jgi:beta-phosphoglucomutase